MIFPFVSPYLHMMGGLSADYGQDSQSPWDNVPDSMINDNADNQSMRPWDVDHAATVNTGSGTAHLDRRHALGAGLSAFGASMLEASGRGDWGGGLGRGMRGFSEAFGSDIDAQKKEQAMQTAAQAAAQHQQTVEARAAQAAEDAHRATGRADVEGTAKFGAWQQDQQRAEASKAAKSHAADQMVAEIHALAAGNPNDPKLQVMAKRATGYALGDDSDLDKLAALHGEMTGQAFHGQDAERATTDKITGLQREQAAGVVPRPQDAARRADRQLAISEEHLKISRQRLAASGGTGKAVPLPLQAYDRIERRVKQIMATKVGKDGRVVGSLRPATPAQIEAFHQQAVADATKEFRNRVYNYTKDAQLVPDDEEEDPNP